MSPEPPPKVRFFLSNFWEAVHSFTRVSYPYLSMLHLLFRSLAAFCRRWTLTVQSSKHIALLDLGTRVCPHSAQRLRVQVLNISLSCGSTAQRDHFPCKTLSLKYSTDRRRLPHRPAQGSCWCRNCSSVPVPVSFGLMRYGELSTFHFIFDSLILIVFPPVCLYSTNRVDIVV